MCHTPRTPSQSHPVPPNRRPVSRAAGGWRAVPYCGREQSCLLVATRLQSHDTTSADGPQPPQPWASTSTLSGVGRAEWPAHGEKSGSLSPNVRCGVSPIFGLAQRVQCYSTHPLQATRMHPAYCFRDCCRWILKAGAPPLF
jgi:hypothetical protein